ncbi:uncharacterized protein PgNI_12450 [Pyricularia grisea]|uniref:Uncharacterized protein n=1 Tax=Pyricularia grisea TaxID=148305 RepID=A0A6P8AMB0_PYRGI|nr:uncharacterized protein PgNI_12450 [Pyricularia grisea]TLD03180.1 hypothetical protein PgNI_12450 [Pyricularia grisea]
MTGQKVIAVAVESGLFFIPPPQRSQSKFLDRQLGCGSTPVLRPNQRRDLTGDGTGRISVELEHYLKGNEQIGSKSQTLESEDAHRNCHIIPRDQTT